MADNEYNPENRLRAEVRYVYRVSQFSSQEALIREIMKFRREGLKVHEVEMTAEVGAMYRASGGYTGAAIGACAGASVGHAVAGYVAGIPVTMLE